MKRILALSFVLAIAFALVTSGVAMAYTFTGTYSENFDSLGASGTALPATGWSFLIGSGGSGDWTTSITSANVAAMTTSTPAAAGALLDTAIDGSSPAPYTQSQTSWYNVARSTTSSDRVISTSPTQVAGQGFQLLLTNDTGSTQSSITVSYDIVKFHNGSQNSPAAAPYNETLPGYQLWYYMGSAPTTGPWTNVSALNPTLTDIPTGTPNTLEYLSLSRSATITGLTWANGQNLYLRWVDDNAVGLNPDQIIGLNNVVVTPIPAAAWLLGSGLLGLVAIRRRMKK